MSIKVVLFDLDGTLLPMDQDHFLKTYLGKLAARLAPHGYDPQEFLAAMWRSTGAMVGNDGTKTNERAFWDAFSAILGTRVLDDYSVFEAFYDEEFDSVGPIVAKPTEKARALIEALHARGIRTALATNPLFPTVATEKRIAWAGLKASDFELFTTYENAVYSKPNPKYYLAIADQLGVDPAECVMVGNDADDDMVAASLGMKVFLLTDHLINKSGTDISQYPNGDFDALAAFLKGI